MPTTMRIDRFHPARMFRATLGALMLGALSLLAAHPPARAQESAPAPLDTFPKSTLEIRSHAGRHWLKIWMAETNAQQMQGLMFVRKLPADQGMLFPLPQPRVMTMWMKNTLIPLDMLFIDHKGRIVCLRERAQPESLDLISCDQPVKAVLEIAGGQAAVRGIKVGDTVVHARLRE